MAGETRWIFTRAQLIDTPSRKCGIDSDKELNYRQQTANFIQDMGQRLQVTQLCINTAIVYMHRFYMFHSFTKFNRNNLAAACLFLAAKVEEQPRKLEHVLKVAHMCIHRESLDLKSEAYLEQAQELVVNENILLQTLGFDIQVDHPHTHVVKTCSLVRASKDLAQTSYFLATNSLHLTSMCLQNKPTVVACVCIHLACKWSNWEIPQSNEGREWFWYTDKDVTLELLEALTQDFLTILDRCPSKLKKKILTWKVCIEKKKHELSGREGEGVEPTPLSTCRKPSSAAGSAASATSSASGLTNQASASASARGQTRRIPAPPPGQPGAAPSSVPGEVAAASARPSQAVTEGGGDAGMRRVKTEPVLTHQSMTPKEYLERRERKAREMREQQQRQQQQQQQQQPQHTGKPGVTSQVPGGASIMAETKERHHMDIFNPASSEPKPSSQDGQSQALGGDGGSGQRSRERPHGEPHHRSHQGGRGHDSQHRHHQGPPLQHRSSQQPGGHPSQQASHPDRHHQHRTEKVHDHANNGHSEPHRAGQGMSAAPAHVKTEVKVDVRPELKTELREGYVHRDVANVQPPHGEPPPPSSQQQKDLKIKINRKPNSVSPSTDVNVDKSLKMKIKLPASPSAARREERVHHKASPVTISDGLKLKLDLKGHRTSRGEPVTDDRHGHSKSGGGHGSEMPGSERGEYQLANQGASSLKLVISKGKLSGSSDSPGSDKSSKRHHSHHSRSGEKHHSRKRSAPTASLQDMQRTASTARGSHIALSHHPSKMHRTDSGSDLRPQVNTWPDMHMPQTNGAHGLIVGGAGAPNSQTQLGQIQQMQLQQTQQTLATLIELHQHKLMQSQLQPPHNPNYGPPPLPPPGDGTVPPPPPPPTELPPFPPYSYN